MELCEKYADWITDAALGELAPSRETELLAHAAGCDACQEAYQQARELATMVDRGVASFVAGEASPYFASRLRACIGEERAPVRFPWLGWRPIAARLLVAALAAVAIVSQGPRRGNPTEPSAVRLKAEANLRSSPSTNEPQVGRSFPNAGAREGTLTRPISRQRRAARNVSSPPQPEVLVPAGELDAILQFARAVRSGQIDGEQLLAAQQETEKPLEIARIEIEPLSPLQPEGTSNTPDDGRK